MKMNTLKKTASAVLAAVMAFSSLTALSSCGKKEPVLEKRTNVYTGTEIVLPEGVDYVQNLFRSGENVSMMYTKVYTVTYDESGNEVKREPGYQWEDSLTEGWYQNYENNNYIATLTTATGEISEVPIIQEETDAYINNMVCAPDGTTWALLSKWEYNEDYTESKNTFTLCPIDPATGVMGEGILLNTALVNAGMDESNLYINNVAITDNGMIYMNAETALVGIDRSGTFKEKIEMGEDGWLSGLYPCGDKLYIMFSPNNGNQKLKVVENGKISDFSTDALSEILRNYAYNIYGFTADKMYYGTSTGVGAYDFASDTGAEIMNFINSDIYSSNTNNIVVLSDDRIAMAQTDWSGESTKSTVAILTRVPDEQLQEEIILELGCVYTDYYLTKAIIRFNKQNTGVRVSVRDYSQYNNEENEWKGASTQFNNDIVTGNVPDIILLSTELPVESYFQKGLFADLNKFIDDPENGLNRANYLKNIFRACEVDGKLNSMILSFTLYTLAAKSQYVGTEPGWTFDEMMTAIRNMPEGMSAFMEYSRKNILEYFFTYSMDTFVNWDTGETYFDEAAFIEFIEFLATCPEKGYWESMYPDDGSEYVYDEEKEKEYSQKYDLRFYKDYSLFYMTSISDFSRIMNVRSQFASNDVTLIGYPTNEEGSNGATIVPQAELAISSQSLAQDEAWSFIKFVLSDEEYSKSLWTFSPNLAMLEDMKAKAPDNYYYYEYTEDDLAWYKDYYSEEYYEYMKVRNQPLDEATIDQTMDLIKGASKIQRSDSALLEIINEELSVFFSGTRSAEETARIIDSRASIYVSENS